MTPEDNTAVVGPYTVAEGVVKAMARAMSERSQRLEPKVVAVDKADIRTLLSALDQAAEADWTAGRELAHQIAEAEARRSIAQTRRVRLITKGEG